MSTVTERPAKINLLVVCPTHQQQCYVYKTRGDWCYYTCEADDCCNFKPIINKTDYPQPVYTPKPYDFR